jgi:diaminohydroxyphosphoribosylaminopyrimidine deaminase / 5-amino-6-(5-phosphoribosylamino)uracil reductase
MVCAMTCHTTGPTETSVQMRTDEEWMRLALDLARRALGRVAPNPAVGAVIVRDGVLVGQGFTEPPGGRHAEIVALDEAGLAARGATMYVTLEPCAHYGRTPPCLTAVLEAGIARVVISVRDPNPLVNGRSIQTLLERGVDVELGVGAREATRLNAGFFRRIEVGFPEVHVKYAMSLDGKIAAHTGESRWITGPEARQAAHVIRDRSDAILVGIGTVLDDAPMLTTRLPDELAGSGGPRDALRVVLDSHARTPVDSPILNHGSDAGTLIAVTERAPSEGIQRLTEAGADVIVFPSQCGRVSFQSVLAELGRRGVNSLMVEGGAGVIGSLADEELIDRITAFIAPVVIGGTGALSPVGGAGAEHPDRALRLVDVETRQVGRDVCLTGYVAGRSPDEEALACLPES